MAICVLFGAHCTIPKNLSNLSIIIVTKYAEIEVDYYILHRYRPCFHNRKFTVIALKNGLKSKLVMLVDVPT